MKVLAYMPLHYGLEYLEASIKSIDKHVDKIVILYTPRPSYGFGTTLECPETESQLRKLAEKTSDKIQWESETFHHEGEHRSYIQNFTDGYDLTLAVDADEIWDETSLRDCLESAMKSGAKRHGILGFVNFWKSFDLACYDGFAPVRIINNNVDSEEEIHIEGLVYHMSCFQSLEIVQYKWECHGHKNELRDDWWDLYLSGATEDVHPVARGLWNAVAFDKTTLPKILKNHRNYGV